MFHRNGFGPAAKPGSAGLGCHGETPGDQARASSPPVKHGRGAGRHKPPGQAPKTRTRAQTPAPGRVGGTEGHRREAEHPPAAGSRFHPLPDTRPGGAAPPAEEVPRKSQGRPHGPEHIPALEPPEGRARGGTGPPGPPAPARPQPHPPSRATAQSRHCAHALPAPPIGGEPCPRPAPEVLVPRRERPCLCFRGNGRRARRGSQRYPSGEVKGARRAELRNLPASVWDPFSA